MRGRSWLTVLMVWVFSGAAPCAAQPTPSTTDSLPLSLGVYTRQVQLGTLDWAFIPGLALAGEIPRWRHGPVVLGIGWQLAVEHHPQLHARWLAGVKPNVQVDLHPRVALQLGLGLSGVYLHSLWAAYHFDSARGWSRGASTRKWAALIDLDLTAWLTVSRTVAVGLSYGIGVLFPFAPANEVPLVPLTLLGVKGCWVYGA